MFGIKINKKYSILYFIMLTLAVAATLSGCTDDLLYEPAEIPDAEVEVTGKVSYRPLVPTEVKTRGSEAPVGKEYTGIRSLYVFFFNSDGEIVRDYTGYVDFTPVPSAGSFHDHVTFKKKVRAGRYYVYAVANISADQISALASVTSKEKLRRFKLDWNDNIADDIEMFGVFKSEGTDDVSLPDNENFETDALITITPDHSSMHSWVRRAVSKVTVDFDGDNLKEGVTVYIRNAVLKNVASAALLGAPSKAGSDDIGLSSTDYSITYGAGASYTGWPAVTKSKTFSPADVWKEEEVNNFHDDAAKALPCYENLQGEPEGKSKLQDSDGDGIIDSEFQDGVENGTYLEVEGYYVADRPEYKSNGRIIYRFMLGKDAVKNFDLVRNHHYKITMRFKDYGNDVDWHIEYAEQFLDATYPDDVNYQGKFFTPDFNLTYHNAGHKFSDQNVITVTSCESDGKNNVWIEPEISYTYYSHNDEDDSWSVDNSSAGWLTVTEGPVSGDNSQKQYTFVAAMSTPKSSTINDLFPKTSEGFENAPYNLSNPDGGNAVKNTANCYVVGAKGWYAIPLVYGNAITDGDTVKEAYSSPNIVNHLNKNITKPFIKDNPGIDLSNVSVKLIWQDAENLIDPKKITYDPNLFEGKGGIKFQVATIREGNAVIALIDNKASEDDYVVHTRPAPYQNLGNTKAVWSWHIWATRFGFDFEKNIRIRDHEDKAYDVMPVNLGWCAGNTPIRYYKRRKCVIKFKVGDHEIVRTIEQYPHFAVPRGDHPYYQWGRKDPFVGTNMAFGNKPRWTHDGTGYKDGGEYNPPKLYIEPGSFDGNKHRKDAKDCLEVLVKNPDKWLNATRQPNDPNDFDAGFYSTNKSFTDLWSYKGCKTVYDPCPPGYQVGDKNIFTGFTDGGENAYTDSSDWYDVLETNMLADYYDLSTVNSQVLELYTDTRKVQSIVFPVTGYRDYDSHAEVVEYPSKINKGQGFVWTARADNETKSFHLKFQRNDMTGGDWFNRGGIILAPAESFYNCNGFAVRPVSIIKPTE